MIQDIRSRIDVVSKKQVIYTSFLLGAGSVSITSPFGFLGVILILIATIDFYVVSSYEVKK